MTFDDLCAWMKSQILPHTVLLAIGQGNPPRVVNQATKRTGILRRPRKCLPSLLIANLLAGRE